MRGKYFNVFICLVLIVVSPWLHAQNTRGVGSDTSLGRLGIPKNDIATVTHKILLVPFYPKMCMSEIDKDVHETTHQNVDQITQEFRKQLDLVMYQTLSKNYAAVSILQGRNKSDSVLSYIYGSTGYKYDLVPGVVPDVKTDNKDQKGHYVKNGQLEVPVDYSKRFMNVSIGNTHLLSDLNAKYHTDTFVFINELDIKNVTNPSENLTDDTYRREIDVHYAIIDKDGKSVAKGLATTFFPFRENDPKQIGEKYFSVIAHAILKDYAQGLTIGNLSEQQKKQAMSGNVPAPK